MVREELEFISEQDGLKIKGLLIAHEKPKAVLQIAHGMCEHKERYISFMEYMAEHQFACVINDHRGHGGSVKKEEDLGYFYENGGQALVEDLHQITVRMKERFAGLPYGLFGHSMGSLAVRCYAKKYDAAIDGLIVCGCPSEKDLVSLGQAINKVVQKYKGDHGRSDVLDDLFFGSFDKAFAHEGVPHAWICSDRAVVDAYNEDKLCNFTFTLNGYEALLWLVRNTYSESGWRMDNPSLPIHFISGAEDTCRLQDKKFQDAVDLMRKVGYINVDSHLYPHMRHEILNEIGKEEVYEDILDFYKRSLQMGEKQEGK